MTDLKSIYERIISTCEELHRSANQVAAAARKPDAIRNMRRNIEAGKDGSVNVDTVVAIAHQLGISPGWLITGEGESGLKKESDDNQGPERVEGGFVVLGEDRTPAAHQRLMEAAKNSLIAPKDEGVVEVDHGRPFATKRGTTATPRERSLKQHIAELRADSVRLEQAIAVAEGAMLSAGLKPEYLEDLREIIQEALEAPLVLSSPDAEVDARRALAQSYVARLLKKRNALSDKE